MFIVSMSSLNKVTAIKLAGQPECLVGLSDLALPQYLAWLGTVELCRAIVQTFTEPEYVVVLK